MSGTVEHAAPPLRAGAVLTARGLPPEPVARRSTVRFPDGADFRLEISSIEGPRVMRAAFEAADAWEVTVNRVSQGSGAMLLTERELREMARIGADRGAEVSLFIGPREEFDVGGQVRSPDGAALAGRLRGTRQLRYAIEDVQRAVDCGIRGFLVGDPGALELLVGMQRDGQLPASVVWKISVVLAPSNPVTLRQLDRMGASTVNIPSDVTIAQLAEMRAASSIPLDLYVESPDPMGGVVRGHEAAELVAVGAPLYVKLGLRNSRPLYPCGEQLVEEACAIAREKAHRAALVLEWMRRHELALTQSAPHATGLGVPQP